MYVHAMVHWRRVPFFIYLFSVFFDNLEQQRDAPLTEGAIFGARPH
jgi:hypothetical protein